MGLAFLMVRLYGLHAIRVVTAQDEVIFITAWHEVPESGSERSSSVAGMNWI